MTEKTNPFEDTRRREHRETGFGHDELTLANRNHGIALEAMRHDITPVGLHYLLSHFDIPYLSETEFSLEVAGAVDNGLKLSMEDIRALPQVTLPVTLECAGNGRGHLTPRQPSMPWLNEAVGTASWTGTRLSNVLELAGLKNETVEIAFLGADVGSDRGIVHAYGRSLTPEQANADEVMLCYAMNGQPLLPQHGAPLRLIVPGWYGMASVKWLTKIEAMTRAFDGFQQVTGYQYRQTPEDPGTPVTTIRVKSLMIPPGIPDWFTRERLCEEGTVRLRGRAWSGGSAAIERVEVGVNGDWHEARLDEPVSRYAWRGWSFDWQAVKGSHELCCRATDANGDVQPVDPRWDETGLGNNAVHRLRVHVR